MHAWTGLLGRVETECSHMMHGVAAVPSEPMDLSVICCCQCRHAQMIGLVHELAPDVICKAASKHIRMTGLHIKQIEGCTVTGLMYRRPIVVSSTNCPSMHAADP